MIWFLIALCLIVAIVFFFLFPKLSVFVEYRNGKIKLVFKTLFFRYTLDDEKLKGLSKKDKGPKKDDGKTEEEKFFSKVEKIKGKYDEAKEIIDTVLSCAGDRVEFSDIFIRSKFGTGDAASTGMLYGAIWTLIGNVYAFLCRFFNIKFPEVELVPSFNEKAFEIEAEGIIKIRIVHIITAAIRGFKVYSKHKKQKGAV
ncbi:MAG: DUF2953 domain-containing protein [Clostridia bacterium]|nr:DUF2953 domain-containing protein [Clostridia bacterium]